MSEIQIFKNAEFGSVRTITVEGEPHFIGKGVAEILGYSSIRKKPHEESPCPPFTIANTANLW